MPQITITRFAESALKVQRAYRHINEIQHHFATFLDSDFCKLHIETEPDTGHHLLKLDSLAPMPADIPLSIGDTVHNLRAALDYLTSKVVRDAGGNDSRVSFPMHETRDALIASFETHPTTGKKGGNALIKDAAPDLVEIIVDTIKPYKTGNFPLWALGKIDNIDKHSLLVPIFMPTGLTGVDLEDENSNVWTNTTLAVGPGGTLRAISTSAPMKINSYGKPTGNIFFADGQFFDNKAVIPTLEQISQLVLGVIQTFEAHFDGCASD